MSIYLSIYLSIYICLYIHIYIFIYMSIYTHTHIRSSAGRTRDQGALQCQARAASAARCRPGGTAFNCFTCTKALILLALLVQKHEY